MDLLNVALQNADVAIQNAKQAHAVADTSLNIALKLNEIKGDEE